MSQRSTRNEAAGRPGQTVLYLPKGNRNEYFQCLLLHGKEHQGWQVSVVCQAPHKLAFTDVVEGGGQCFDLPDFTAVQDWESDTNAVAALQARIAECERFNGVPANRLLLSGARNLGRGFSHPHHLMPKNNLARHMLRDNMAGMWILRRIFSFAFHVLDTLKPDMVLAGEWSSPLHYAIVLAARTLGIKCAANRNSKIISGHFFWTSELSMLNGPSRDAAAELARTAAPVSREAHDRIKAFRNQPETLGYVEQKWKRRDRRGWSGSHLPYLRIFVAQTLARLRGEAHTQPDPAIGMLLAQYRATVLSAWQRRYFRRHSEDELKKLRFVYFPMHKEGEVALTFQAPAWHNQANTVRQLSAALPAGYLLLVREHRSNHGRRPSRWYRNLLRLPNVILIDSFDSQFKYLRHAEIVVTENGSSGWEALMLGKRVLTLSECHYDGAGLTRPVGDPTELAAAMIELLARSPVADPVLHDSHLGWQIDAEHAHSFSGEVSNGPDALDYLTKHRAAELQT